MRRFCASWQQHCRIRLSYPSVESIASNLVFIPLFNIVTSGLYGIIEINNAAFASRGRNIDILTVLPNSYTGHTPFNKFFGYIYECGFVRDSFVQIGVSGSCARSSRVQKVFEQVLLPTFAYSSLPSIPPPRCCRRIIRWVWSLPHRLMLFACTISDPVRACYDSELYRSA